jgi:hypothetical protein
MKHKLWSLCKELADYASLQDNPPGELVNRALNYLSTHGCWLDEGGQPSFPSTCVIDSGNPQDCWYAERIVAQGGDKCSCHLWSTATPIEDNNYG